MKNYISVALAILALGPLSSPSSGGDPLTSPKLDIPYGRNESVGRLSQVNGIKVYFETYGKGPPMSQLHGNGQNISALGNQIKFFSARYQVIAADSRGHGKSEMGPGRLTYEQMAEDANALLEELGLRHVYVLGWSDGGILGLLLALNHPDKVAKLAIMGANLDPQAAYGWASAWVSQQEKDADAMIAKGDTSMPWPIYKQYLDLLGKQPNIPIERLKRISAPTLVMAADKDVIRDEHTLRIFHAIPKAHLCIFPGATHMIPWEDPGLFNQTVEKFFRDPFTRPDTKQVFLTHSSPSSKSDSEPFSDMWPADDSRFSPDERHMVAAARDYLEKARPKPLDARYKVERTKDGYEVFVMFVNGYENGRPLYYPGGHGIVVLGADGSVIRYTPGS